MIDEKKRMEDTMRKELDCRGMSAAESLDVVRLAMERMPKGTLKIFVNSPTAQEAISDLEAEFCSRVKVEEMDGVFTMWLTKRAEEKTCRKSSKKFNKNLAVYLNSHTIGSNDEAFGKELMEQFLEALKETGPVPDSIVCVNSGVFLTTEGSHVLNVLQELEEMGVDIFSSKRSLIHYGLTEKLSVGKTLNMFDIIATFAEADAVWRP